MDGSPFRGATAIATATAAASVVNRGFFQVHFGPLAHGVRHRNQRVVDDLVKCVPDHEVN